MSAEENRKILEEAIAKWKAGDGMAIFILLADDVVWTVIDPTAVSAPIAAARRLSTAPSPQSAPHQRDGCAGNRRHLGRGRHVVLRWDEGPHAGRRTHENGTAGRCDSRTERSSKAPPISTRRSSIVSWRFLTRIRPLGRPGARSRNRRSRNPAYPQRQQYRRSASIRRQTGSTAPDRRRAPDRGGAPTIR